MTHNQYQSHEKNLQAQKQDGSSQKTLLLREAQRPPLARVAAWLLNKFAGTVLERMAKFITGESLPGRFIAVSVTALVVGFFTDLTFVVVPALSTQSILGIAFTQMTLISAVVGFGTGGVSGAVFGWISGWILQQVVDSAIAEIVSSQVSFLSEIMTWVLATLSGMAAGKLGSFLFDVTRAQLRGEKSTRIEDFFDRIKVTLSLIHSPFKMTEKKIEGMVKKKNVKGLVSVLKKYSDRRLIISAIRGLEKIATEKSLQQLVKLATLKIHVKGDYLLEYNFWACQIVAQCGRPELVVNTVSFFALRRFPKSGGLYSGTEFDLRLRAIRLLGSMGIKQANYLLEIAFGYGTDDKFGREAEFEIATNSAIIKSGSVMIPFLKKKLLDSTKLVNRPYTQSDRAAILLKEIDESIVFDDTMIVNGLLNIAKNGISIRDSYETNYGRLSAIEGLVLLNLHNPFFEYIKTIALDPYKNKFLAHKALDILGRINTGHAQDALKSAFDIKNLDAQRTTGYMLAVNSAIIACGNSMIPFLEERLNDTTIIHFSISVSYDKVYLYKITQSKRAEIIIKMIDAR